MKTILTLSILFSLIALPALGDLTEADLNKIRLIVKEEIKAAKTEIREEIKAAKTEIKGEVKASETEIKTEIATINLKIDGLDARLRNVETGVAELRGRNIGFSAFQNWIVAICAVAAIILSIIALRKASPTAQDTPKAGSQ